VRLSSLVCLLIAGAVPASAPVTAFIDVTVVSVDSGTLTPGQTVLVEGDRITWVGPSARARIPADATRIPGAGRYLAPGLADMHAHVDPEALGVFLAYGVTTVRELNGDNARLSLRTDIAAGRVEGPTLIVGGPLLAGESQRWRHGLITTADQARAEINREADLGYDNVKVYDGLTADAYDAIVATARAR
jgi:predicted amidohydrolase YtcJ